MKKIVSFALVITVLVGCISLAGCGNGQATNPTPNDIVEALKAAGFEYAHCEEDIDEYGVVHGSDIKISYQPDTLFIGRFGAKNEPVNEASRWLYLDNYNGDKDKDTAIKILNIIMPIYDDDFDDAGEEIITNLEKLSEDKSNGREFKISIDASPSYHFEYEYHGFEFDKCTDENLNDQRIDIDILQKYLQKNNLTAEEYFSRINEEYDKQQQEADN